MRVDSGQDLEVVTEQPVQHEEGQGRRGGVRVDHDVFQRPVILGGGNPEPIIVTAIRICVIVPGAILGTYVL